MTNLEINAEIHEYNGKFYIAKWSDKNAQWSGSLRADIAKGSGCSGFFCRSEKGLPGAGGYSYASKSAARRAVRKMNDWDE